MVADNFIINYYRYDTRLFACVEYKGNIVYKEYLDIYNSIDELEADAKALAEMLSGEYKGELK